MLEKARIWRSSSVPNIKMSQTIAHPKLHFTPGLGQLSAQMVREWLLEGDFLANGWRFSCVFSAGPSLEEVTLELILCQNLVFIHFRLFCRKIPGKKPVASENRSVRATHVRESQDKKRPSSSSSVKALCSYTDCFVGKSQEKTSCVRKSQRQRETHFRESQDKIRPSSSSSINPLCSLPNFRLFSRKNPRKKPSCVRKSQRQRVARQRVAGPKKGLEDHPLSKLCVHCHTLHCFVGSPQERTPVASENPKKEAQLREKMEALEKSHVREPQAQKRP